MAPTVTNTSAEENLPSVAASPAKAAATEAARFPEPAPEALRYARVLERGARLGLACLFLTFPLYVLGIVKPHTPPGKTLQCLTLDVHQFSRETGGYHGWGWVGMLHRGDFLNFAGIAILAGVTAVCCLAVIPPLLKRHDRLYAILALVEVLVLILAASGLCTVGH
jgi:hypothetical protein